MVQLGFAQTRKHGRVQNSCSSARVAAAAVAMNVGDPVCGDGHVYTGLHWSGLPWSCVLETWAL